MSRYFENTWPTTSSYLRHNFVVQISVAVIRKQSFASYFPRLEQRYTCLENWQSYKLILTAHQLQPCLPEIESTMADGCISGCWGECMMSNSRSWHTNREYSYRHILQIKLIYIWLEITCYVYPISIYFNKQRTTLSCGMSDQSEKQTPSRSSSCGLCVAFKTWKPRETGSHFPDDFIKTMCFPEWKYMNFNYDFIEMCSNPYPEPVYTGWSSVHWNATGMPLVDPVYIGIPLEKLSWNSPTLECHWRNLVESAPHWDATGETLTFAAYTGTPLEGLWQPTHAPTHIGMQSSIHASLKWQDGGTPVSKWTGLCIFSLYLEFTALQWMPVLLLTYVSTSTLLCACLWYEHHYSFCVFGVASQMKSV